MEPASGDLRFLEGKVLAGRMFPDLLPIAAQDRVLNLGCGMGPQAIVYRGAFRTMLGLDVNRVRLQKARRFTRERGIAAFEAAAADVEHVPVRDASVDKVIAVDVLEHVRSPDALCREAWRVLREDGRFLVTFPAMHDRFVDLVGRVGRAVLRRERRARPAGWHPDEHNQDLEVAEWMRVVQRPGFEVVASRATTMFPPLHLYGVPRFWFRSDAIHRADSFLARRARLQRFGQTVAVVLRKPAGP